ncbi:RNA-dependent RNA polymerase [Pyrus virus A]|uniref:RNA-dependent RNA polymerase n=1 Tax=Pyrus virus A TaxID=3139198 RepID=A0AAU6RVZ7_9CLOS
MDLVFPDMAGFDFITRTLNFEFSGWDLPALEDLKLIPSKSKVYTPRPVCLPMLMGKGERARPATWKQVLLSLSKRNFAAPKINENHDIRETSSILFKSFENCLNERKTAEFWNVIEPDLHKINSWLTSRDGNKYKSILNSFDGRTWQQSVQNLRLMIKGDLKPKMENSGLDTYAIPSNIIYYEHVINMFFSPIFLEIHQRINYCLRSNIILYSGLNLDELGSLIETRLKFPLNNYFFTEIDFSKFDKSQSQIIKLYEQIVYMYFKFSPNIYDNFRLSEYFVRANSTAGVQLDLFCQRRTGSPNTWLSNTLATLAMITTVYNIDDIDLLLVSGDDSLILTRSPLPNKTTELNKDFGMEAKFLNNPVPYFCSKFIVQVDGHIKVVPDPVRFFEKLSVPLLAESRKDCLVLRERFISYRDLMKEYFDDNILKQLDNYLSLRYNTPENSSYAALSYIHCLLSSFKNFEKLFDESAVIEI